MLKSLDIQEHMKVADESGRIILTRDDPKAGV